MDAAATGFGDRDLKGFALAIRIGSVMDYSMDADREGGLRKDRMEECYRFQGYAVNKELVNGLT
jgi:hypothetical protein